MRTGVEFSRIKDSAISFLAFCSRSDRQQYRRLKSPPERDFSAFRQADTRHPVPASLISNINMSIILMESRFIVIGYICLSHVLYTPVGLAACERIRRPSEQKMIQARLLLGESIH